MQKVNALASSGFRDDDCLALVLEVSLGALVNFYMTNSNLSANDASKLENAIEAYLRQPTIFMETFFNSQNQQQAVEILTTEDPTVLAIVTSSMYLHRNLILDLFLKKMHNQEKIGEYMSVLFYLFVSESTTAFANTLKLIEFLASTPALFQVLSKDPFMKYLHQGLESTNSIVSTRTFEFIIELSHNAQFEQLFLSSGLIAQALKLYFKSKNDILEKLNYIELLKRFSFSKAAMQEMKALKLVDEFVSEAFNENAELYVRRDLLVIICQFFRSFLIEYDEKMMSQIYQIVRAWLGSPKEDRNAGFEVSLAFFNCEENLVKLLSDQALIDTLTATNNMKEHHLMKSLQLRVSLLTENKAVLSSKKVRPVTEHEFKRLLVAFYNSGAHLQVDGNLSVLKGAIEYLLRACQIPFDEIELSHLSVFEKLADFDDLIAVVPQVPDVETFLLYLKFKGAKGEAVLIRKAELLRKLRDKLSALAQQKGDHQERIGWMIDIINSKGPTLEFNIQNETQS